MAEVDPIDFDPTTEEGQTDVNEEVNNEYDLLIPRENEPIESWQSRFRQKFGRASGYAFDRFKELFKRKNPGEKLPEYMELENMDFEKLRANLLISKYPNLDENLIEITLDENGKQQISFFSARLNDWTKPEILYNEDKAVRQSVEKKIRSGKYNKIETQLDDIEVDNNAKREKIQQRNELIDELRENNENDERVRELERLNEEEQEQIEERESIKENLEERMPLRERVKRIFKKYGFTAASVLTAVGVTIGVIISQLKSGLSTMAKGVGNGLKTLGKKLGEILPGMIGAIASFIFKTAGEVVSFLAEHAWLLIVAAVAFVVEKMKR